MALIGPFESVDVAGTPVSVATARDLIDRAVAHAEAGGAPQLITYTNASNACLARDDAEYAHILREKAAAVYADGQAVVWASRLLGRPLPERVNAGDFWPELLGRLTEKNASIYLLGGQEGLAEAAADRLRRAIPDLKVAGTRAGYFSDSEVLRPKDRTTNSAEAVAHEIADTLPSVLFVGMSAPVQERWAARWLDTLNVPVVWCVGALFEYYAGRRPRAPVWIRRAGLEWAYRLALEPGRLWRRYLIGNPRFVYLVLKQWMKQRRRGEEMKNEK